MASSRRKEEWMITAWRGFPGRRFWIPAVLAGLLAAGCGAVKLYPGPRLPRDQVAVLEIGNVILYSVDGKPVDTTGKVEILPGVHDLRGNHNAPDYGETLMTYTFTAEAGHRYVFDADYHFGRHFSWRPWVKDTETGEIVGSFKKPSGSFDLGD
jgi:hypothetical protein